MVRRFLVQKSWKTTQLQRIVSRRIHCTWQHMSRLQCLGHIWPVCLVQQFARCRTLERVARFQDFQILKECTDLYILYSVRMARAAGKMARFTLTSFLIFAQISLFCGFRTCALPPLQVASCTWPLLSRAKGSARVVGTGLRSASCRRSACLAVHKKHSRQISTVKNWKEWMTWGPSDDLASSNNEMNRKPVALCSIRKCLLPLLERLYTSQQQNLRSCHWEAIVTAVVLTQFDNRHQQAAKPQQSSWIVLLCSVFGQHCTRSRLISRTNTAVMPQLLQTYIRSSSHSTHFEQVF